MENRINYFALYEQLLAKGIIEKGDCVAFDKKGNFIARTPNMWDLGGLLNEQFDGAGAYYKVKIDDENRIGFWRGPSPRLMWRSRSLL